MRHHSIVPVLACVLYGAVLAQQGAPARIEAMPGPVHAEYQGSNGTWAFAGRIVDALTLEPIPGATLYQVPEHERPRGGEFWSSAHWTADRDGFVRVPNGELARGAWFVVDAPGHGPVAEMSYPPGEDCLIRLVPGIDWPIAIHDAFDRPVAGADVGLCLGCGHTPDVRVATTGADGVAWLRGVEPLGDVCGGGIRDIYPRGEGLAPDYDECEWRLGDGPSVLRQAFARSVSGRVLAPNGRPLPGVAMRGPTGYHRGPWAWTDAEGRFHLFGNEGERLELFFDSRSYQALLPAGERAVDLTLPAAPAPDPPPNGKVVVAVHDAASAQPIAGAHVELWHVGIGSGAPGETEAGDTDEHGTFVGAIAAGPVGMRVVAPDGDDADSPPTHDPAVRDVEVQALGETRVEIALVPRTPIRVTLGDGVRSAVLVTHTDDPDCPAIDALVASGRPVPVPAHSPFAFRVDTDEQRGARFYFFEAPPTAPVDLRVFAPLRVRLRVVDESGRPIAANVSLGGRSGVAWGQDESAPVATDANGAVELRTTERGCAFVKLQPIAAGQQDVGHRRTIVHTSLPPPGGHDDVDLGAIVLPPTGAPRLRVERADGSAAPGQLTLLRPGLLAGDELAADGGWDGIAPQAGDRVTVTFAEPGADGPGAPSVLVPLSQQLTGDGPWVLREGSGTLVLDVQDDFGFLPENGVVLLADRCMRCRGRVELRGLPDADLELFVGAEGCDSARVRLRLAAHERREVKLVLRRPR
ncbi:MAG TPA: carboxypeptidase-like regulatory domain-containing protein [Planctomycetota bacterium]|nr:carboxypeptidase-like regulatory domain-containing protein [Planctomycetota bacterium]